MLCAGSGAPAGPATDPAICGELLRHTDSPRHDRRGAGHAGRRARAVAHSRQSILAGACRVSSRADDAARGPTRSRRSLTSKKRATSGARTRSPNRDRLADLGRTFAEMELVRRRNDVATDHIDAALLKFGYPGDKSGNGLVTALISASRIAARAGRCGPGHFVCGTGAGARRVDRARSAPERRRGRIPAHARGRAQGARSGRQRAGAARTRSRSAIEWVGRGARAHPASAGDATIDRRVESRRRARHASSQPRVC